MEVKVLYYWGCCSNSILVISKPVLLCEYTIVAHSVEADREIKVPDLLLCFV